MPRRTSETPKAGPGIGRTPATSMPISASKYDLRELIALRAYELYLQRGAAGGDEVADWLTAEAEVLSCLQRSHLYSQPSLPMPRSVKSAKKAAPKLAAPSRGSKTLATTSSRKKRSKRGLRNPEQPASSPA